MRSQGHINQVCFSIKPARCARIQLEGASYAEAEQLLKAVLSGGVPSKQILDVLGRHPFSVLPAGISTLKLHLSSHPACWGMPFKVIPPVHSRLSKAAQ